MRLLLQAHDQRKRGTIFLITLVLAMSLGFLMTFFLAESQARVSGARTRLGSIDALYEAFAELEKARALVQESGYAGGENVVIQAALASAEQKIVDTEVVVEEVPTATGWYNLIATVGYDTDYERIVSQTVREVDYFSSYNLFVANDDAGVSGSPIGNIHTNATLNFYFPDGVYRNPVTAAEDFNFVSSSGATPANTTLTGAYNPEAERIELDFDGDDPRFSVTAIKDEAQDGGYFSDDSVMLYLYRKGTEQWIRIQNYTDRKVEKTITQVPVYKWVKDKTQPKVKKTKKVKDTSAPKIQKTKTVTKKVWVSTSGGGTTVGGEGSGSGYYKKVKVKEKYWTYPKKKVTYWDYPKVKKQTGTKDKASYKTTYPTEHIPAPENGVLYFGGNIRSLYGDVVGRMTLATGGDVTIRSHLRYRDEKGRLAMRNGTDTTKEYEANPNYTGEAVLGVIARGDVIYNKYVSTNLEVNASLVSATGRIMPAGLKFDSDGNVTGYDSRFLKQSIRRLGGITASLQPMETFIKNGAIRSGFISGQSVFDAGVVGNPPPGFLALPEPTFFATSILK